MNRKWPGSCLSNRNGIWLLFQNGLLVLNISRHAPSFCPHSRPVHVLCLSLLFPSFPTSWILRWYEVMRHFYLSKEQGGKGALEWSTKNIQDMKMMAFSSHISPTIAKLNCPNFLHWGSRNCRNIKHNIFKVQLHIRTWFHLINDSCSDLIGITSIKVSKTTTLPFVLQ